MNRILTTIVQLFLVLGTWAVVRLMWQDLKHDIAEIKNDLFNRK
jgi:cytochrome oxidase assembly protein ShyY1